MSVGLILRLILSEFAFHALLKEPRMSSRHIFVLSVSLQLSFGQLLENLKDQSYVFKKKKKKKSQIMLIQ